MKALVLGGTGFVGRNLVKMLVDSNEYSFIRSVDKVFPETAYLSKEHASVYENPEKCVFVQGNLVNAASVNKMFSIEGGFDVVFDCAAETKLGQDEFMYEQKTYGLTKLVAEEAVKQKVKRFIHLSNAQVYDSSSKAKDEKAKIKPWTKLAASQAKADELLIGMKELPFVILRPAIIYGPGDVTGIAPRIICAAVYKYTKKKMEFLWTGDMKLNTVHVHDVCKAMMLCGKIDGPIKNGEIYNLCDKNDTNQKKINTILEEIFQIKTGFKGTIISTAAEKLGMDGVCETVNDEHMKPWSQLCKEENLIGTPLSPYLDQELLYNNPYCIDGSSIEKKGFVYDYPEVTTELVKEEIKYFSDQKLFPSYA
ncbi:dTDP-D-glucose 4,6-dehydratase, putative [Entamoeba dispar SAW760]|uniref:dTDP-D-glucose 4,6-dehydratase, putative n=1 Tax=Entamoeba dispar (strain ATCC PRA-260 / SAW760) TaxID=370354 RepID=B0EA99_ENTDS|nr:dTDP-D-glucose 4,6-dehydratase, putative [Entamoeba dispar SAW760]EDR28549.1 dTDP-D-glucose 4,6-dehydratase, putative [Entamoeba dispar SAW760]|eukprot:EDR28549.1 dTDP-D-glucose 4,6-dehydratase, putative [Entamoeba dispar SAW760]